MLRETAARAVRIDHHQTGSINSDWPERCAFWAEQEPKTRTSKGRLECREPLILSGHGVRLRVDHGALLVQNGLTHYPQRREVWRIFPGDWRVPSRIVILDADGSLSLDALAWLAEQNVPLIRIDWRGEVIHLTGTATAIDPVLRAAQLAARANGREFLLSRKLIADKIANSISTLRHSFQKSPVIGMAIRRMAEYARLMRTRPPSSVSDLLGIEGQAAAVYFGAWQSFPLRWKGTGRRPIPEDWQRIGSRVSMVSGRNHRNRHATHPVNAILNYAYGILEHQVRMRITAAGLDPTIGYFHGTYRGKAALVYDLMEPARPVTDAQVLEFVQAREFTPADFLISPTGACRLNPSLARRIVSCVDLEMDIQNHIDLTVLRLGEP